MKHFINWNKKSLIEKRLFWFYNKILQRIKIKEKKLSNLFQLPSKINKDMKIEDNSMKISQ